MVQAVTSEVSAISLTYEQAERLALLAELTDDEADAEAPHLQLCFADVHGVRHCACKRRGAGRAQRQRPGRQLVRVQRGADPVLGVLIGSNIDRIPWEPYLPERGGST